MSRNILGMDIGGTYIRAGIVDESNQIVYEKITGSASVLRHADECRSLASWVKALLEESGKEVGAISMGLPAVLNRDRTLVVSAPNVVGLDGQRVNKLLEQRLGIPAFMEKDACLLLYYDLYQNRIPEDGILVGLYIGTGIGNAVLINGVPLVGKNGSACEIGHVPCLDKNGLCSCGNHGCMEVYASGLALEGLCNRHFPETNIRDLFVKHAADPLIYEAIDRLAVPIATEINIFDPDYMILGGGVLAMKNFPRKLLEERVFSYVRKPLPAQNLELLYTQPSQNNGIIGAAIYARRQLGW